jgi:carbonic anhydrase/acetyltransferase-like protein (isoleucine patch superfamily)
MDFMAHLVAFNGKHPRVAEGVFLAPTATLIGDVEVAAGCSIWFGAVLRADFDAIRIGPGTSIQDNCVVHTDTGCPTLIGARVTVGHAAVLEACVVEDGAVIGMSAALLARAHIGTGAMVAAGAVVGEGMQVPSHHLVAGVPAQVKKPLGGAARTWVTRAAPEYHALASRYLAARDDGSGQGNRSVAHASE